MALSFSRRGRVRIGASICLLLVLATPAYGQMPPSDSLPPPPADGGPPLPPVGLDTLRKMSPEGRRLLATAAVEAGRSDANVVALRQTRAMIVELLAADTLDKAALRTVLDRERALSSLLQQQRHDALLAAMIQMNRQDRQIFAQGLRGLQERIERWGRQGRLRRFEPQEPRTAGGGER